MSLEYNVVLFLIAAAVTLMIWNQEMDSSPFVSLFTVGHGVRLGTPDVVGFGSNKCASNGVKPVIYDVIPSLSGTAVDSGKSNLLPPGLPWGLLVGR